MNTRKKQERLEDSLLSPYAARSAETSRREPGYQPDPFRTEFARDRDRILHSRHLRLLMHKTQVIPVPPHASYTTRLTHTLEVTQVARSIARALRLNEDLTEAIGLGHDLGHSPFGHTGEDTLRRLMLAANAGGFEHNEQSLRVVDELERLDLTEPTRQGILCHTQYDPADYPAGRELPAELLRLGYSPKGQPFTQPRSLEAQVVDLADEIAYLSHDTEDMRRAGIFPDGANKNGVQEVPERLRQFLDSPKRETLRLLVRRLTRHAAGQLEQAEAQGEEHPTIDYPDELARLVREFKEFSREHFYFHPRILSRCRRYQEMLESLFRRWLAQPPEELEQPFAAADKGERHRLLLDYIVALTDHEVIHQFPTG